jgi:hypothetical protein
MSNEPRQYRKKPVVIEAVRVPAKNAPVEHFAQMGRFLGAGEPWRLQRDGSVLIDTLEGQMRADPGDYIIRGVADEYYPCKPAIFEATYEPVEDAPPSRGIRDACGSCPDREPCADVGRCLNYVTAAELGQRRRG